MPGPAAHLPSRAPAVTATVPPSAWAGPCCGLFVGDGVLDSRSRPARSGTDGRAGGSNGPVRAPLSGTMRFPELAEPARFATQSQGAFPQTAYGFGDPEFGLRAPV
ncbi:putative outer membrane protein [Methylobacterium aquaticum]|uniref:Putative outer membrane protein n=1 Tax=Methylobacterium aquaticum TaxID=270351 RepID=A0A0C6FQG1_9HYPH|nr:putative outer membrane protein [Methylobacterium aquaticum]